MRLSRILFCAVIFSGCHAGPNRIVKKPLNVYHQNAVEVQAILDARGKIAEGSLEECIGSYVRQGLPLKQIIELCSAQLKEDDTKGFGVGDVGDSASHGPGGNFDPASVTATCSAGNPAFGKDPNAGVTPRGGPVGYTVFAGGKKGTDYLWQKGDDERTEVWGYVSWGGKEGTEVKDDQGNVTGKLVGLSKDQALLQKLDNVADAKKADEDAKKVDADPKSTADEKKAAHDKADAAAKKAQGDPNVTPPVKAQPAGGLESACDTALQGARETLRECNRIGWKSTTCQQIKAQMNDCPDPTLAYINPDAGYVCGDKPDPKAIVKAVQDRCHEVRRPGPDGKDPCVPLKLDDAGWSQGRGGHDVCSDPHAYIDPDGAGCMVEVVIGKTFGAVDVNQIIIVAMDRLGGPIVILPNRNPKPPKPGGDPRPGPSH